MNLRTFTKPKKSSDLPRYQEDDKFKPRKQPLIIHRLKNHLLRDLALICFAIFALFELLNGDSLLRTVLHGGFFANDNLGGTLFYYDLKDYQGSSDGWNHEERILMCIPLRNAEPVIPMMFSHLRNLTYPHELIDIAFLVSDTDDNTLADLKKHASDMQRQGVTEAEEKLQDKLRYNSIEIYEKDFGQAVGQGFDDRHGVAVQGARRKLMGKARNWLTALALKPYHTWVYWRDADIETAPETLLEDLMKHGRDVIVPNVWRPLPDWLGGEQPYDLNSWQESEPALELAKTLHEDEVIVEGYAEYPTWRPHLAYFRAPDGDPDEVLDLDGIGGVSILARAKVFRHGANFPGYAFENHAETEGFGKMSRKMGFSVGGLIHYTVWHQYEPSEDDLKQMKEMDRKEKEKEAERTQKREDGLKFEMAAKVNSKKVVADDEEDIPVVSAIEDEFFLYQKLKAASRERDD